MHKGYRVAVLHQATPPPLDESGIPKPMKPGGYVDSGADIGYCLQKAAITVIIPNHTQDIASLKDSDWSFPDTIDGIKKALSLGANCLWANTVLFATHPLVTLAKEGLLKDVKIVGQIPQLAQKYDDKYSTNLTLRQTLNIAPSLLISLDDAPNFNAENHKMNYPLVIKPIRGRGSEGVTLVHDYNELLQCVRQLTTKYGNKLIVEQYLSGQEITITVMPPGTYTINKKDQNFETFWALPIVKRFNHINGIAPYNGVVAVVNNSSLLSDSELLEEKYTVAMRQCEAAAKIVGAKAPIRVDCRENNGTFFLFDLNMKPNMTGSGRTGREEQDSLTCIAARGIKWSFTDLLLNILAQAWPAEEICNV